MHQNFPFPVSFQGKKKFWKSKQGLKRYFIFCASSTPIFCAHYAMKKHWEKWKFQKVQNLMMYISRVTELIFKTFLLE